MRSKHSSYKKHHPYSHESDVEKGKIKKEKANVQKMRSKQKSILKTIEKNAEWDDEDLLLAYNETLHEEKKEQGNAKVHKERLKDLVKDDSID